MIVSHNIQAMNINRITNENINLYGKSTEKVSSGYRINHPGDYPEGLALSEKMRRQVRGLRVGVENTRAGINFCTVADGALNEVTEMLQRVNQLSVQAENGTNSISDRHAIQEEVDQILAEIDRIADTTTFNEIPIFRDGERITAPGTGTTGPVTGSDIPFEDFTLADVSLGTAPFDSNSAADRLNLQAIVNNDSAVSGKIFNLIYSSGSTSYSSFRLTYQKNDGSTVTEYVPFKKLVKPDEYASGQNPDGNSWWKRSFQYTNEDGVNIKMTQKITTHIPADPSQEKYYNISYTFDNKSANIDVALDFMFNADTAYNNNDICEGYYINDGSGKRMDKWCMFTHGGNWSGSQPIIPNGTSNANIKHNLPGSFSIIDENQALAFSEKISFVPGSEPDILSIGPYGPDNSSGAVSSWEYYNHLNANDGQCKLGEGAIERDIAFSLFWNNNISRNASAEVSFNYGIIAYEEDDNLQDIEIHPGADPIQPPGTLDYFNTKKIWIHSGNEAESGIWLEVDEMNTEVLGIQSLDLTTQVGAGKANVLIKKALNQLSASRGKIGAQQNRLEHTVFNEENVAEKVDAAEAGIRDTDFSSEMTYYSNLSILLRMGANMITEANQRIEKILNVLQ